MQLSFFSKQLTKHVTGMHVISATDTASHVAVLGDPRVPVCAVSSEDPAGTEDTAVSLGGPLCTCVCSCAGRGSGLEGGVQWRYTPM